nr:DNA replication licensing factor MCM5 [Tanacetum cinerariifolium]
MSGWDEEAVHYSDQAQFPHGGGPESEQAATRHTVLRKFKEFIRNFARQKEPNDLRDLLHKNPSDYLPLFETAAAEVSANLKTRVTGETSELEEPHTGEVQIS